MSKGDEDPLEGQEHTSYSDRLEELTRDEVMLELSLREIETLTGLPRPTDPTPEEERAYRALAWENVKLDVRAREEWGGVTPDSDPGEVPDET